MIASALLQVNLCVYKKSQIAQLKSANGKKWVKIGEPIVVGIKNLVWLEKEEKYFSQ